MSWPELIAIVLAGLVAAVGLWLPYGHLLTPSRFRWYRRWRGGSWYLVAPWPMLPYIDPFWCRQPLSIERVFEVETYE